MVLLYRRRLQSTALNDTEKGEGVTTGMNYKDAHSEISAAIDDNIGAPAYTEQR